MEKAINALVALGIAPLFILGAMDVVAPAQTFALYGIEPLGIITYSTFRGAIGGTLLAGGLMMLLGLVTRNKTWYHAASLLVFTILVCRFISVILDGWTNDLLPAMITEIYIVIVLFFASKGK